MSKIYVYGIEFDTEKDGNPRKLRNNVAIATSKAFCEVMKVGRFFKYQIDILTNEVLRGRLDVEDVEEVERVAQIINELVVKGMSCKDIAILRSLYFDFDEIKGFALERKSVEKILAEYEIENPEIETIYGVTSRTLKEWYVPYSETKGV